MRLKKHPVLILAIFTVIALLSSFASAWSSDYDSWQYRKAITINGSTSDLTNYQIPINLTTALYNNTGLIGSWHFTANSTEDSSGYGNNGIQNNEVNCTAGGKFGGGCAFDGTNDYISMPDSPIWALGGAYSMNVWVKFNNTLGAQTFVSQTIEGDNSYDHMFYKAADNTLIIYLYNADWASGFLYISAAPLTWATGVWYNIIMAKNSTATTIYRNGIEIPLTLAEGNPSNSIPDISGPLVIGAQIYIGTPQSFVNGTIDEVKIYNRYLSAQEISDLYNAGKARLDLQDLRFSWLNTTSNAEQNISHWLESDNLAWVKVPNITASSAANTKLYVYYGNHSATYNNSLGGNSTFEFFDDFDGTSIDASKWNATGTWSVSNGIAASTASDTSTLVPIVSPSSLNSRVLEMYVRSPTRPEDNMFLSSSTPRFYIDDYNGYTTYFEGTIEVTPVNVWIKFKIVNDGSINVKLYKNDVLNATSDDTPSFQNEDWILGYPYAINHDMNFGWIFLRKYASFEPSMLSFGAEETHPVHWLKTYSLSGNAKSFFAINETITIKAKAENVSSNITVIGPDGLILVNNANMTNETALSNSILVWNYSFNLTEQAGWYDVKITGNEQPDAFFVGGIWQDNWTDSEGNVFPFRMLVNVSEPNVIERFFEPVDINMDFTYGANSSSIRVVQWNGTNLIDVPSQSYNLTYGGNYATSGNVVFLATIGKNQNETYYIYYARTNSAPSFGTDLSAVDNSPDYEIQNSNYKVIFTNTWSGLLKATYDKKGDNNDMSGYDPMQYAPEAESGPTTYTATDPDRYSNSLESGALRVRYNLSGSYGAMNYNLTYIMYAHTPYIILETNVTSSAEEYWDHYIDQQFYLKDGYFTSTTWKNATGIYEYPIGAGNGNDQPNLGNLDWIALYNNISGNSFGTIYLETSQSRAYTPNNGFNNDASYERYLRTQYYQGDVIPGDYFYSKTAIVIWNALDGYEKLNETYYRLKNPLGTSIGASETYDIVAPINTSSGFIPVSPEDNESVTCYSYWSDNLMLDYAIITVNSSAYNNQSIVQINSNESWVNYTINAAVLEAGNATCNITVYDTAMLANSTQMNFVVSDNAAPKFASVTNQPNNYISLDPQVRINITANLTEYTGIDTVILQYRNDSGEWANSSMNRTWNSTYNYSYSANFTPETNGTWQYRIYANDTSGNSNYSEITNLSIAYESVWQSSPANFSAVSGLLGSNISAGNLIVNNTADTQFGFRIESNWENKDMIFFNNTPEGDGFVLNLDSGGSVILPIIVTAKSVERSDSLTITIDALNGSATPASNTTTATIISYASGPFLLITITDYNVSVTQGDTGILLKAKVQNKGNESATNTWLAFELPSGWSITSGNLNKSIGTLSVNGIAYQNITATISDSATTGTQAIQALSGLSEKNETQTSVTVTVLAKPATNTIIQTVTAGGGGGGGAAISATGLTTEQKEKLFQTKETYELVRGEEQNFTLKVENPFDGTLENVSVEISGFLSQYLIMYPPQVDKIPAGKSFSFSVVIEAPTYFKRGTHILNFTITGHVSKQKSSSNTSRTEITHMKESRLVTLIIYEVSEKDASRYLNESVDLLNELNKMGLTNDDLNSLVIKANESFENKDYENLKQIYEAIKEKKESAFATLSLLDEVTQKRDKAAYEGIPTTETSKLISFSKSALERGDYETALERAEDAKMAFAVETAGKFNIIRFTENNWQGLGTGTVTLAILLYLGIMSMRYHLISRKCKYLKNEEKILIGMIKQIQKECFEDGKLSIEEYIEGLVQYEKKISEILQETIRLETLQTNLFKFLKKEKDLLLEEKNKLLRAISETQSTYINEGSIETKIYENRVKSCVGRVAEIEEMLANIEAKNAMKGGKYISW